MENLVRWKVRRLGVDRFPGAGRIFNKDEVAKKGSRSPTEQSLALGFAKIETTTDCLLTSVVGIVSKGGATKGFEFKSGEKALLKQHEKIPLLGGAEKTGQDDQRFVAMHFAAPRTMPIYYIDNHVPESIQIFSAGDSSPVSLVGLAGDPLLVGGFPPASPKKPDCLAKSLL